MFAVSNNKGDRYAAIKKKCCVERPVPSQVVTKRSMTNKGVMSIATKIAIQLNCKIGGAPWSVKTPGTVSKFFKYFSIKKVTDFQSLIRQLIFTKISASLNKN